MAKKSGKHVYAIAILLFLGGVGTLAYSGFSEGSVYFLNVSEALAVSPENLQTARLFGSVSDNDLVRETDGRTVSFRLIDNQEPEKSMSIHYVGVIPDTFKEGAEVIIEGGVRPDGVFHAKTLMTKCPSKYQKENRG